MRLELCKSRSSFMRKAFEGQIIEVLWPKDANPEPGWEDKQENRRRGQLRLTKWGQHNEHTEARVELESGSIVDLPPKNFWYQPKGDK